MAIITPDTGNELFTLATEFVANTSRHLFLTGKAGTGKTTFLKFIKERTNKNAVVAAPTGVAAINAGGTTLHSLFQLPFGPFIPGNNSGFSNSGTTDQSGLLKQLRLNATKRELLQEMDLLIIDEVSMLRCDMLDAIDTVLRSVRRNVLIPFGGVQVLFIGDLYQLPPVVPKEEWSILKEYYESPFFFHAKAIEQSPPLYIELKKIYRQNEQHFIDILNRIRNNVVLPEDLEELNSRQLLDADPLLLQNTITLTTHNRKADSINAAELEKLSGKTFRFQGIIEKEFNEHALPTELTLLLKEGAQVMFIRNDSGENRKFFNGKLAIISRILKDEIFLLPAGEQAEFKLEKETWKNIRYNYNKEKDHIEEEELGSFTQYPVRLAWAITIHKSQGLTFERAIIDAGQAFAPGQVYVALSRCTSLNGLILSSKIYASAIQTNPQVIAFAEKESGTNELSHLLQSEKKVFVVTRLTKLFEWKKMIAVTHELKELASTKQLPGKETALELINQLLQKVYEQKVVAERFTTQLQSIAANDESTTTNNVLQERITKAITWFVKSIFEDLIIPVHKQAQSIQGKSKVIQFTAALLETEAVYWNKLQQLQEASFPEYSFEGIEKKYARELLETITIKKKGKAVKGSSQLESLDLFLSGKSVEEISAQRGLVIGTIQSHLAEFVLTGQLDPLQLLSSEKMLAVLTVLNESTSEETTAMIKERLGDSYSYSDIRVVQNFLKRKQSLEQPS
ncbi:MAG: helix-turn-helix domain-containing protein [Chitinophagaceae bacterium]